MRKSIIDVPLEELRKMPLQVLQGEFTDSIGGITSPEEERLLQQVINEKTLGGTMNVTIDFRVGVKTDSIGTDAIQTPEDEARAQAIIDKRVSEFKKRMQVQTQAILAPVAEEIAVETPTEVPQEIPQTVETPVETPTETPVETPTETPETPTEAVAKFCQYCDSKGGRAKAHRKTCTRPKE